MEWVICSPDEYYSLRMKQFIQSECRLPRNQWIYKIIQNNVQDAGERVFINTPAWCLCLDKHRCPCRHTASAPRLPAPHSAVTIFSCSYHRSGEDARYLVVFKNTALKTIRDLAKAHVPMLEQVRERLDAWLREHDPDDYLLYFHFLPSVFQLHLHVRRKSCCRQNVRMQPLQTVIRNLRKTENYYQDALILTKFCKKLQKAETHTKIESNI